MTVPIQFKRLHPEAKLPTYAKSGDAGADLYMVEDLTIQPGEIALVPVGFAVAIPLGYEMQIRPRSGHARRGLTIPNSPATIDSGYRGEVKVIVQNLSSDCFRLRRGDRIAQAIIAPVTQGQYVEVEELPASERGAGGFGSTGS